MKHLITRFFQMIMFGVLTFPSFAQELKTEKKSLSSNLDEVYQVNPANKKIKEGVYKVIDDQKRVLVMGTYKNGKKDSVWTYYNTRKEPIQQFDFTNHRLAFDRTDSATSVTSTFQLSIPLKAGDKLDPPHKIGGANYGFFLLFDARDIPADVRKSTEGATMSDVFYLSDQGELLGWQVVYKSTNFRDIIQDKSVRGLPADAYEFMPATINDHPVNSQLILTVVLDLNHLEVPANNNTPTQNAAHP